jgi:hypothetical protein
VHLRCCPLCYHKSPYPAAGQRLICSQCPSVACLASGANNAVRRCPACDAGRLVLNRPVAGAVAASCDQNRCAYRLVLLQAAVRVRRATAQCPHCAAFRLAVDLQDPAGLRDHLPTEDVCVFCDPRFAPYIYQPNAGHKTNKRKENDLAKVRPGFHDLQSKGFYRSVNHYSHSQNQPFSSQDTLPSQNMHRKPEFLQKFDQKSRINQLVIKNKTFQNFSKETYQSMHTKTGSNFAYSNLSFKDRTHTTVLNQHSGRLNDRNLQYIQNRKIQNN